MYEIYKHNNLDEYLIFESNTESPRYTFSEYIGETIEQMINSPRFFSRTKLSILLDHVASDYTKIEYRVVELLKYF